MRDSHPVPPIPTTIPTDSHSSHIPLRGMGRDWDSGTGLTEICPYCCGPSLLLTRGGHDPACVLAARLPVTARRPDSPTPSRRTDVAVSSS